MHIFIGLQSLGKLTGKTVAAVRETNTRPEDGSGQKVIIVCDKVASAQTLVYVFLKQWVDCQKPEEIRST